MTKFLSLFISFLCLNISLQLDCSSIASVCHQYSTKYNAGCHWFSSRETKCVNIDYDDGCTINDSGNCVATEENPNGYECRFIDNSLYPSNTRCKKIIIDQYLFIAKQSGRDEFAVIIHYLGLVVAFLICFLCYHIIYPK